MKLPPNWKPRASRCRWPRKLPKRSKRRWRHRSRALRVGQAGRHPHRRAAENVDAPAHRGSPQGETRRNHRHQAARPDLQAPERAREDERADVRRRDAGNSARRLRLFAQPRLPLPFLPRRHLRFPQPNSPLRPADRHDRGRANSSAERKRTLLRPAAGRGHQRRRSEQAFRQGFLRRSNAAASRQAHRAGNHRPTN